MAAARPLVVVALAVLLFATLGCTTTPPPRPEPGVRPVTELGEARRLLEAGEAATVEPMLASYLRDHPRSFEAALLHGRALYALGRWAEAVERFELAVELEPGDVDALLWLGRALGERIHEVAFVSKLPMAQRIRSIFERAVEVAPDRLEARIGLARYYAEAPAFAGGDPDLALLHAAEAVRLDPLEGHLLTASIHETLGRPDDARRAYEAALDVDPRNEEARRGLERLDVGG